LFISPLSGCLFIHILFISPFKLFVFLCVICLPSSESGSPSTRWLYVLLEIGCLFRQLVYAYLMRCLFSPFQTIHCSTLYGWGEDIVAHVFQVVYCLCLCYVYCTRFLQVWICLFVTLDSHLLIPLSPVVCLFGSLPLFV
jgi:hypothetical protein